MVPIEQITGRLGNQMFQHAYMYAQMRDGVIQDTYVQDPAYFEAYEKDIKFLYGQNIEPINQVAIHVRRGDYVNNPFYVNLTQSDYYEEAMKEFKGESFLIFSDDIEWCKKRFQGKEFEFCDETDPIKTMNMMAGCKGHIIANSSFSWWGAFISPFTQKVIAPKEYYSDGKQRTKYPESWMTI